MLLALVCFNFYLERKIYLFVLDSEHPEHKHMVLIHSTHTHTHGCLVFVVSGLCRVSLQELISIYVSVLRRVAVCVGVCVLLCVCLRYQDPVQQNLQVLQQLRETQRSLEEALQHAGEDTWHEPDFVNFPAVSLMTAAPSGRYRNRSRCSSTEDVLSLSCKCLLSSKCEVNRLVLHVGSPTATA